MPENMMTPYLWKKALLLNKAQNLTKETRGIRYFFLFICIILLFQNGPSAHAAPKSPLGEQLWSFVDTCYSLLLEMDESPPSDTEITEDIQHGYLSVSGLFPTCGCFCSIEAGAYKKADGSYLLLKNEKWLCTFETLVSASEPIENIFPEGFGLSTFTDQPMEAGSGRTFFVLSAKIPQKGTKTEISIEQIPAGMEQQCPGGLCYSINDNFDKTRSLALIGGIAIDLTKTDTLIQIINGRFSRIDPDELVILQKYGEQIANYLCAGLQCDFLEKLQEELSLLYERYLATQKLKYGTIVLDWDAEQGRFFIVEKRKIDLSNLDDFRHFLIELPYWMAIC